MELYEKISQLKNKSNTSNTTNQNGSDKKTKVMTDQEKFTEFLKTMTFTKGGARRGQKVPNDMPNGERSKRCHPHSDIYCWSCGYDLSKKHLENRGCSYKNSAHKDEATIENRPVIVSTTQTGKR